MVGVGMRLPFFSRAVHAELEIERQRYADLLDRYERLMMRTLDLRRDGFNLPPAADLVLPPPDLLPDEVAAALDGLQLPGQLYAEHETWARRRLGQGASPKAVAHELSRGGVGMTIVEEDEAE